MALTAPIKETYIDFYQFLRKPVNQTAADQSAKQKVEKLFAALAIEIPVTLIFAAIVYGFEKAGIIDTANHRTEVLFRNLPLWEFALFAVLITPLFEELIFRLFLGFNPKNLGDDSASPASTGKLTFERLKKDLIRFWISKFHLIFYFSSAAFACLHLSNYELSPTVLFVSPLLIAPQFIAGLFFGYLRVQYSFMLGYFMHAIHNAFFISLALLFIKFFE